MQKLWLLASLLACAELRAAPAAVTIDSFETEQRWEVKEFGDAAELSLSTEHVSKGKQALAVRLLPEGKKADNKGVFVRRGLSGRPDRLKFIELDLFNGLSQPIEFALALESDEFYEAPKIKMVPGWNRKVHVDLTSDKFKAASSNWEHKTRIRAGAAIGTISLVLYTGDSKEGKIWIDQLTTAEWNPSGGMPSVKPVITKAPSALSLAPTPIELLRGEKFEVKLDFQSLYHNPYDPAEIDVEGFFVSPSGKKLSMPGFLFSGDVSLREPVVKPVWKVRLSPNEAGIWAWYVRVKNPQGEVRSSLATVKVIESDNLGFIRVDSKDPHYFSFDSGKFFYPIGQNMGWDSDENYRKNFSAMHAAGENWSRVWMSNWSFGLEWKEMGFFRGLGNYNLNNAERLDKLLDLAKINQIYLQLVFDFHGAFSSKVNAEWPNNPYNAANGGMLKKAEEFWTDQQARDLYKKRVRYIVARWGYSQQIMAWEFFNEINFADNFPADKETLWLKDFSSFVKNLDPHKHMITTSYYDYYNKSTYDLPTIDFTQYHAYQKSVVKTMQHVVQRFKGFNKPFIFAEFGNNSADGVDDKDKKGVFLHAGIWGQAMQPVGGNAMPWWWNTHIAPNDLYYHFKALAAFLKDVDRRGKDWQPIRETWAVSRRLGLKETVYLHALRSPELTIGWIVDSRALNADDGVNKKDWDKLKFKLAVAEAGSYKVEFWDTIKGEIISTRELKSEAGRLVLELPKFRSDIAFKIRKAEEQSRLALHP